MAHNATTAPNTAMANNGAPGAPTNYSPPANYSSMANSMGSNTMGGHGMGNHMANP